MFSIIDNKHVARGMNFLPFCEQEWFRGTKKLAAVINNAISGRDFILYFYFLFLENKL